MNQQNQMVNQNAMRNSQPYRNVPQPYAQNNRPTPMYNPNVRNPNVRGNAPGVNTYNGNPMANNGNYRNNNAYASNNVSPVASVSSPSNTDESISPKPTGRAIMSSSPTPSSSAAAVSPVQAPAVTGPWGMAANNGGRGNIARGPTMQQIQQQQLQQQQQQQQIQQQHQQQMQQQQMQSGNGPRGNAPMLPRGAMINPNVNRGVVPVRNGNAVGMQAQQQSNMNENNDLYMNKLAATALWKRNQEKEIAEMRGQK